MSERHRTARRLLQITLLGMLALSPASNAAEFSDALSACLLASATEEDKRSLVRWMFAATAQHPALVEMSDVPFATREQVNRDMAALLVDFLSIRCFSETQAALRSEGALALQASLGVLGQLAATELFTDGQVTAALGSLETYISAEDLERRLEIGQ